MSDAEILALVEERKVAVSRLKRVEKELSDALTVWGRERGYLIKLTPEQALREMRVTAHG